MKNIKKYVEFLLEYDVYHDTRTTPVEMNNSSSILDILREKAPWYLENIENITPIYRGLRGDRYKENGVLKKALTISPSNHKRFARNVDNHYIEMIDNSEYWSEYPKRSESIICSFHKAKASIYGKVYRVIPLEENSNIAICPREDVFFSFPVLFKNLSRLNGKRISAIDDFNDWLSFGFGIPDDENISKDFISNRINSIIDEMSETDIEDYDPEEFNDEIRNLSAKIVKNKLHFDDFYSQLEEWMSPEENGFRLIKYNRNSTKLGRMNEVYTNANCLLVLEDELQKELGKGEN